MDDLPANHAACGPASPRRRYLLRFFFEVRKNVRAFLFGREQARGAAPEPANRYFVAFGFHRAINRVRTDVENFSARDPAGVRWKQLRVRPPCTGRGPSICARSRPFSFSRASVL